jgi:hypothetical protein
MFTVDFIRVFVLIALMIKTKAARSAAFGKHDLEKNAAIF